MTSAPNKSRVKPKFQITISRLVLYFLVNYSPSSKFEFYIYIHIIILYVYII